MLLFLVACALCILLDVSADINKYNSLTFTVAHPREEKKSWNNTEAIESGIYRRAFGGLNNFDRALLGKYYSKSNSVFEFGTGESTSIAAYLNIPRYTGVDSDPKWLETVRAISPAHFRFAWADIGPLRDWGFPTDVPGNSAKFPFYSISTLASESQAFDFYMIDGRFRVACLCAAMLHASRAGKAPDSYFLGLHDYHARHNNKYSAAKALTDRVEGFDEHHREAGSRRHFFLVILQRKKDITDEDIMRVWKEYNKALAR